MISYFDSRSDNKSMVRRVPSEIFSSDKSAITKGKDKETEINKRRRPRAFLGENDGVLKANAALTRAIRGISIRMRW